MARDILASSTPSPAQPSAAPTVQPLANAPAPPPAQEEDVLAGALPDWDLLPASPFVRRVK